MIETITEEYESEDSQGNIVIKKRHVQVKKKYKTVDGKVVEKIRGKRRVKKRRKNSQGVSVDYSTEESYTEGERSVGDPEEIRQKIKEKLRNNGKISGISARVSHKFDGRNHNSFAGNSDFEREMKKVFDNDRDKLIRTSKNSMTRRGNSTSKGEGFGGKEQMYYYDPKTGRRIRYCESGYSPTRKNKNKLQFAENHVPHGENCGPNCMHLIRANMYKKKMNRKLLPMNTNNLEKFSQIATPPIPKSPKSPRFKTIQPKHS